MQETEKTIRKCRELLAQSTPLKNDCGRLCSANCCRSLDAEETGMLLFPGEDAFYSGMSEWKILRNQDRAVLVCSGTCDRRIRPLSCRLFPLLPILDADGNVKVRMDPQARHVCPLYASGVHGVCPEFVETVKECGELLAQNPQTRCFLEERTREYQEMICLRREFLKGREE